MDTILLVEDDTVFSGIYSTLLQGEGYLVETASCGNEGLEMLAKRQFSLVITSLVLPDISGLEILSWVREFNPKIDVILITGNATLESAILALKHGAKDYLIKPVNPDEFKHSVAQCIQKQHLIDENKELRNLVSLFRASQAIAGCLDREQLYSLLLEAIAREASIEHAIGFIVDDSLEFKAAKGVSEELCKALSGVISERLFLMSTENHLIELITLSGCCSDSGFSEAFLVPIFNDSSAFGMIVLLNKDSSPISVILKCKNNILFLIEQFLNTFKTADSLTKANDMLFIDDVSGLYNHRYLDIALERELKRVERYSTHLAVLFLDIDSFKLVNDLHGHIVGSRVLAEFGELIKKSVREVDVVIRYGGDEYTVILVETACATAGLVADRIRAHVEEHIFFGADEQTIRLTCSIGYACCPDDTVSKDELLEMADRAMYAGKSSGKNQIQRISSVA